MLQRSLTILASACIALFLVGCETTKMKQGGGTNESITGAAAGGAATNANSQLERCASPLGTLSLVENQAAGWYTILRDEYRLPPTSNLLRIMVAQSNCFIIVERGAAGMAAMSRERELMASGEMRAGSNIGRGQMVASDYALSPEIVFSNSNAGGMGAVLGGLLGSRNANIGRLAGGLQTKEASAMLTLVDNRSGVQVAASQGSASKTDWSLGAAFGGSSAAGGAGAYSNTEQGKVISGAFADAFNQMVIALRAYKPQTVQGQGLGGGGRLTVDGSAPPAQTVAPTQAAPSTAPLPTGRRPATTTVKPVIVAPVKK
ncbi:CsgG/HfaB family protein [Variovorax sp. PCZ-1]|uniref:CsgG/HfaB family protein n=1 Tax=Variovorax sp. PCZ-1 TaxID=2835533 RepID=UPI001BCFC207|nr:CsgG/HfaB family protein [Variovorax sp. PCZ-1]MBS7808705.1 peptidoglycan-binding protein [Variovorax sp. PCZ-1]